MRMRVWDDGMSGEAEVAEPGLIRVTDGYPGPGDRADGAVAQLGEHLLCKQGVSGSIPLSSTKSIGVETDWLSAFLSFEEIQVLHRLTS